MTIRDSKKSSTLDPASMDMLELGADDLDKVAGGAPTRYIVFTDKEAGTVTPNEQQVGGGLNLSL